MYGRDGRNGCTFGRNMFTEHFASVHTIMNQYDKIDPRNHSDSHRNAENVLQNVFNNVDEDVSQNDLENIPKKSEEGTVPVRVTVV